MSAATRLLLAAAGGTAGVVLPAIEAFNLTASPSGGWTWFTDPRAISYNGWTYFGYVNGSGDVAMRAVENATMTVSAERMLSAALEVDDHDDPTFLVRDSDHKLLCFYTKHDDTTVRLRISTTSLDTDPDLGDGFASEVSLDAELGGSDYTYPNPIQLTGETSDPIWLFYRHIAGATPARYDLTYSQSTDGGATWSSGVRVTNIDRAYWKIVQASDTRIDFALTDTHPFYGNGSIYHFYYEGGAWFKSDGSSAGSLPLDTSDMTLVYDGTMDAAWIWDIVVDSEGRPVVAFAVFESDTDHRYYWGRYEGAWSTQEFAVGGTYIPTAAVGMGDIEEFYSGGMSLQHDDPTWVWASIQTGSGRWDIVRYRILPSGVTSTTLTSAGKNVRPITVIGADPALRALWMTGTYASYVDYAVGTMGGGLVVP